MPFAPINRLIAVVSLVAVAGCSLRVKNVQPATPYDFAYLHRMAIYAQAAYASDAEIRTLCKPAFNTVHIQTIASTNNKYFLATSTTTQTQLISVAGTSNIENVLLDADFTQEYEPGLRIPLHRGFGRAARLIYDDMQPRLIQGYRLQVTGHSLGGAEAVILGMMFQTAGMNVESIVTFGQPKVTTSLGVESFNTLPLIRVANQDDLVPELPLEPYRHLGPVLVLFSGEDYSVVEQRPLKPATVLAAWKAFQNHQAPAELPHHYVLNYLANLSSKVATSRNIPYPAP